MRNIDSSLSNVPLLPPILRTQFTYYFKPRNLLRKTNAVEVLKIPLSSLVHTKFFEDVNRIICAVSDYSIRILFKKNHIYAHTTTSFFHYTRFQMFCDLISITAFVFTGLYIHTYTHIEYYNMLCDIHSIITYHLRI